MSLMDKVREYNQLKDDKKIYLERLDKSLKRLEKNKPDYTLVAMNIIKGLEKKLDVSFSDSYILLDSKDFKVGDRVIRVKYDYRGKKAKVVHIFSDSDIGIEFDKKTTSGDCRGYAKAGHGFKSYPQNIKKIIEFKPPSKVKNRDDYHVFTKDLTDIVVENNWEVTTKFKVGNKVRVKKSVKEPMYSWGPITHNDVGVVREVIGKNIIINFKKHSSWRGYAPQLKLVTPPRKFSKASAKSLFDKVVADIEAEFGVDEYVLKREELIKKSIPRLEDFNFNNSDIINYFSTRLSDVSDVEEALK